MEPDLALDTDVTLDATSAVLSDLADRASGGAALLAARRAGRRWRA